MISIKNEFQENRTVLLTPKFENDDRFVCNVAASGVSNGQFTIRAIGVPDPTACSNNVFWEVKAVRSDVEPLSVEVTLDDSAQ